MARSWTDRQTLVKLRPRHFQVWSNAVETPFRRLFGFWASERPFNNVRATHLPAALCEAQPPIQDGRCVIHWHGCDITAVLPYMAGTCAKLMPFRQPENHLGILFDFGLLTGSLSASLSTSGALTALPAGRHSRATTLRSLASVTLAWLELTVGSRDCLG
jgi:hypothetical protein